MSLQRFNGSSSPEAVLEAITRDGGAIIEKLVPDATVDQVCGELSPYLKTAPVGEGRFWGRHTRRFGGILAKSPASSALCAHPLVLKVVRSLLEPYCNSIQLNGTQIMQILPGEPEQVLHADGELWPTQRGAIECMVNTVWALDEFTKENGGTRIVPGSHVGPLERLPAAEKVEAVEMPKGSVAIWLGSTVHGGGANVTDRPRTALSFAFCLGWLRQAENQYLSHPPEVARTLPPEIQSLLGYDVHCPNLGLYEGHNPREVLTAEHRPEVMPFQDHLPEWALEQVEEYYRGRPETVPA